MRKILILGTGCPKCDQLEANARKAVAMSGEDWEVVKISDINAIMGYGVMITPALAIGDEVKSSGKLLSPDAIRELMG